MDDQPVERHRIDERLQRRSRRAHRARHVERAAARHGVEIGIADIGEHPRGRDCRRRSRRASPRGSSASDFAAAAGLRPAAATAGRSSCDGSARPDLRRAMPAPDAARETAWRAERRGTGSARASASAAGEITPASAMRSSTRSRPARAASGCRSGRSRSGERGIATSNAASAAREARRLLAEIGEARGPHAFEIAAERRQRQIERRALRPSTGAVRAPAPRPSRRALRRASAGGVRADGPPASSGSRRRRRHGRSVAELRRRRAARRAGRRRGAMRNARSSAAISMRR